MCFKIFKLKSSAISTLTELHTSQPCNNTDITILSKKI